jgi:hypothetical protein
METHLRVERSPLPTPLHGQDADRCRSYVWTGLQMRVDMYADPQGAIESA